MNHTILLVGHGSREESGNEDVRRFTARWRAAHPDWRIELCFIEFGEPGLQAGLRAAAHGSSQVLVLPLILNAAGHVKMEIPEAIEQARLECPGTGFLYAPHLTACDPLLQVLRRRLRGAMQALDMPDPRTTGVVLLGRGSSDRQANGEMAKMARWLQEDSDHELVDLAFTGITWPRLERVVQRQALVGMRQVVVLPYYLFTGTLMQRIARQVDHLRVQYPTLRLAHTDCFGLEPEVFGLLDERVAELLAGLPQSRMPCDGCKYRELAHDLGHSHHHGHPHDAAAAPGAAQALSAVPVHEHMHTHGHAHEHTHEHTYQQLHEHAAAAGGRPAHVGHAPATEPTSATAA